jgi:hypothetical protein
METRCYQFNLIKQFNNNKRKRQQVLFLHKVVLLIQLQEANKIPIKNNKSQKKLKK